MFRRSKQSKKTHRVRAVVPHGHGTSVSHMSPPLSAAQNAAYNDELANIPRPYGGAVGCAYTGFEDGIKCLHSGGMPSYAPSVESFVSKWEGNVAGGFPMPNVSSPGGYKQIMLGGGSGSPECAEDCTCLGDPSCPCRGNNNLNCGYVSVNQTCVEPVPNGTYKSLAACEAANARGNYAM
jgi:hypothetical protein